MANAMGETEWRSSLLALPDNGKGFSIKTELQKAVVLGFWNKLGESLSG
jgi:hypothetical protein